ncbi:MAG: GNAT family N-acetyltransferase [Proteobacteria bacterium]|nr:GNAT family N-acetyltransferase [Pseudomonadota bacterium]MBU1582937.1 GNAT family N-acetyltransferase [Pseudomonadota bacterium]MBU2455146.1 GNAT family N-acetyltransferase [Pseudomonadota bacterium]MBU2629420.1 GNAT family N-acetyltransferase [Pseudomonadota bacterium]
MIRQASLNDVEIISELIQSQEGMWQSSWSDNVLERAIKSSDGLSYVWDEGSILGFICGHDVGFRGYISDLIISKKSRRQGIAGKLVKKVEEELKLRGCHLVIADVWHEAEEFYRSLSWRPVSSSVTLLKKDLKP